MLKNIKPKWTLESRVTLESSFKILSGETDRNGEWCDAWRNEWKEKARKTKNQTARRTNKHTTTFHHHDSDTANVTLDGTQYNKVDLQRLPCRCPSTSSACEGWCRRGCAPPPGARPRSRSDTGTASPRWTCDSSRWRPPPPGPSWGCGRARPSTGSGVDRAVFGRPGWVK